MKRLVILLLTLFIFSAWQTISAQGISESINKLGSMKFSEWKKTFDDYFMEKTDDGLLTADRKGTGYNQIARLMWFQLEASRSDWGFGVGQVPWCGTSRLDVCQGLPLQLQSDYTFTAIMGWWGPWGAWLWLLLFSLYVYCTLVYCARTSPTLLTPLALLQSAVVAQAFQIHLLFLFAVLLLVQTWITVAGNLGWLPLTGITWPLMSYGKTSLWFSTFFIGAWGMRREHA
jgi:cell division protein FtsW (lipid II flippase)